MLENSEVKNVIVLGDVVVMKSSRIASVDTPTVSDVAPYFWNQIASLN
jgi:hypothetical protein